MSGPEFNRVPTRNQLVSVRVSDASDGRLGGVAKIRDLVTARRIACPEVRAALALELPPPGGSGPRSEAILIVANELSM